MTDRVRTLPQPPIVWGPSEINEWIAGSFPSQAHGPSGTKRAQGIDGMAVKVWSDSVRSVRARVVVVLESLGYALEGVASKPPLVFRKGHRTVVVRFHPALLRDAVTVALSFAPPVVPNTATKIAGGLADEFPLGKVSMSKAPRTTETLRRERTSPAARPRSDRPHPSAKQ